MKPCGCGLNNTNTNNSSGQDMDKYNPNCDWCVEYQSVINTSLKEMEALQKKIADAKFEMNWCMHELEGPKPKLPEISACSSKSVGIQTDPVQIKSTTKVNPISVTSTNVTPPPPPQRLGCFECSDCHKGFKAAKDLYAHQTAKKHGGKNGATLAHPRGPLGFECIVCKKFFKEPLGLITHQNATRHGGYL